MTAPRHPQEFTLSAAWDALRALRDLHRICLAMDADIEGERPSEAEYQAAMKAAERALRACPQ